MSDELEQRVAKCFSTILPDLSFEEIMQAEQDVTPLWDSVATLTLISLIEEEFNCWLGFDQAEEMTSFPAIVAIVRAKAR